MTKPKFDNFFFIRHGRTAWNAVDRIIPLQNDMALDDSGFQQAAYAADKLSCFHFSAIITSPLLRARQTADIIASKSGSPVVIDKGFIEADLGSWGGKLFTDICIKQGLDPLGAIAPDYPSDAEPKHVIEQRVLNAFISCSEKYIKDFLIVAHGGTFSALNSVLNIKARQLPKNATPFKFNLINGSWVVENLAEQL